MKPKRYSGNGLSDGSYLATVGKKGVDTTVRIIQYQIPGFRPARLLTTILDPAISARELVIHYHRRWDIEIAYDEIKTHQCATLRGRAPTIFRSKKPELVEQELYAVLIVYNLVRNLIHQAGCGATPEGTTDQFSGFFAVYHRCHTPYEHRRADTGRKPTSVSPFLDR